MSEFQLNLAAVAIYTAYLLLPGYIFCTLAGIRRNRFLLTYGISFTILILTQLLVRISGGTLGEWYVWLHASIAILMASGFVAGYRQRRLTGTRLKITPLVGFIVIIVLFTSYHLLVGPYTEIPSDLYWHLGRVKNASASICSGSVPSISLNQFNIAGGIHLRTVPFLHAVVACELEVQPITLLPAATLVSSLIFLGTTYWFTFRVIATSKLSTVAKMSAAVLTVLFTLLWLGVDTFSYVRYYAYFPSIFNFSLLFVTMALFLDFLERRQNGLIKQLFIPLLLLSLLLVMWVVHQQELLFTLILFSGIAFWRMVRSFRGAKGIPQPLSCKSRVLGILMIVAILLTLLLTFINSNPGPWGRRHIIDLGHLLPVVRALPIANPSFRFWDTLALFGFIVYLWYFFRYHWFTKIDYLTVAMISPLITLFNPLFVLWFLHVSRWDLIWRISYLMPLAMAGAFLVVFSFARARKSKNNWQKIITLLLLIALFGSLLPFDGTYIYNHNSRMGSLSSIDKVAGAGLWADLVEAVESVEGNRAIAADGSTYFLLSSSTHHASSIDHASTGKTHYVFTKDNMQALLPRSGDLLVVNRRDGVKTMSAQLSGHWRADVLEVSKYYPKELDDFIVLHSDHFKLLWSKDRIWLYEIL